mmetsp:Transcript_7168/g.26856  ORF Transcript_7168/g.26856 Transcript_7168/m.26856 type:complete len:301 (+) Transcript_7168:1552-2454(+)
MTLQSGVCDIFVLCCAYCICCFRHNNNITTISPNSLTHSLTHTHIVFFSIYFFFACFGSFSLFSISSLSMIPINFQLLKSLFIDMYYTTCILLAIYSSLRNPYSSAARLREQISEQNTINTVMNFLQLPSVLFLLYHVFVSSMMKNLPGSESNWLFLGSYLALLIRVAVYLFRHLSTSSRYENIIFERLRKSVFEAIVKTEEGIPHDVLLKYIKDEVANTHWCTHSAKGGSCEAYLFVKKRMLEALHDTAGIKKRRDGRWVWKYGNLALIDRAQIIRAVEQNTLAGRIANRFLKRSGQKV